jgi:hypothetical protein
MNGADALAHLFGSSGATRWVPATLFIALIAISGFATATEPPLTVGMEGQLVILLPAKDLQAAPLLRDAPLTLRIASTRSHGSSVQYDLRYIALVPGEYDLRDYLRSTDKKSIADLPAMRVRVSGVLPPNHRGELALAENRSLIAHPRYKWILGGIAIAWAALGVALFRRRKRTRFDGGDARVSTPQTLAERMRPLIEQASAGSLAAAEKAQLERLLLNHWRERLRLESLEYGAAIRALRAHPEAGVLLRALEDWLHRPPGSVKVDIESFLAPYTKAPTTANPTPLQMEKS